ncbi:MAG: hypothetical protein J0J01_02185 [Reyranella sp.]|nr:hypothetical protein [Reyranella sp.]
MSIRRRTVVAAATLTAPALLLGSAYGQVGRDREKDLRIFVGFEPGGGADQVARTIASQLQRRTSRRVIVENRTGQFGAVPGELVKKAPPDGAELALLSSTTLVSRLASKTFPFDPAKDLAPITKIGNFAIAFAVAPQLPVDTFKDYLAWIQEGDDQRRRIAVSSNTTFVEVLNVLLSRSTRQRLEPVYFRGITAILSEMRDGKIPATVNTMTSLLPPHRGRRARILLATGTRRLSTAPNIPIGPELGYPSLDMEEWFAFFAAPGTPAPLVAQLNNRLRSVIADREVTELLKPLGLEVDTGEPDELAKLIEAHRQTWQLRMATTGVAAAN